MEWSRRVAWQQAAVALDGYRRLWGLMDAGPAQHPASRAERASAGGAVDQRGRIGPAAALLGWEPRRDLGQRRDWRTTHAALQRLDRAREQRPERENRTRRGGPRPRRRDSSVHDPWLVRRLPDLIGGAEFAFVSVRGFSYVETRDYR